MTKNNLVGPFRSDFRNENNLNPLSRINWRASLVPAAAVIPAPIAYINVVAVKKLVVGFLVGASLRLRKGSWWASSVHPQVWACWPSLVGAFPCLSFTVNKLECSKQGVLEYISME